MICFRALFFLTSLYFVASPILAQSLDVVKKEALINQAEELMLNSERTKALELLKKRWKDEKGKAKKELATKMDEFARIFLSESGQQAFELGQSLTLEKGSQAENQYKEALKLEDNNISILFAIAALRIREKNWNAALDEIEKILELVPSSEKAQILKIRVQVADGKLKEAQEELRLMEPFKSKDLDKVQVELWIKQEEFKKAKELLQSKFDKTAPDAEVEFLKFRLRQLQKEPVAEVGQSYLNLCKNVSPLSQREMSQSPFKCMEVEGVAKIISENEP